MVMREARLHDEYALPSEARLCRPFRPSGSWRRLRRGPSREDASRLMDGADARRLIAAIVDGLERRRGDDGVEAVLKRIAEQDTSDGAFRAPVSKSLPACRHLPELLGELRMSETSLATALAAAADGLAWRQNPNYSDQTMGQTG